MDGDDDNINRAIGRLEGKMDEVLNQMKMFNKGQSQMWEQINEIKIELATLKTQKVGWSQLGTAIKVAIGTISTVIGIIVAIISVKGGV